MNAHLELHDAKTTAPTLKDRLDANVQTVKDSDQMEDHAVGICS